MWETLARVCETWAIATSRGLKSGEKLSVRFDISHVCNAIAQTSSDWPIYVVSDLPRLRTSIKKPRRSCHEHLDFGAREGGKIMSEVIQHFRDFFEVIESNLAWTHNIVWRSSHAAILHANRYFYTVRLGLVISKMKRSRIHIRSDSPDILSQSAKLTPRQMRRRREVSSSAASQL